MDQKNSEGF